MLKFYTRLKLDDNLTVSDTMTSNCWVFAENPTDEDISFLLNKLHLDDGLLMDSIDVDEAPRVEYEDGLLYVFSRFAYVDSAGNTKTSPVMFVIGKKFIATISISSRSPYKLFAEENQGYTTINRMDLLTKLLKISMDTYSFRLNNVSKQVRYSRSKLNVDDVSNKDFIQLVEIGDVLNEFLGDIVPLNSALQILAKNKQTPKFTEDELDTIEDIYLSSNQLLDNSKGALKTIVNIREAYSNIATNNLNKKITLLTTLTVVLTIPTIVGSFWGMNVTVPFHGSNHSFLIIISVTLLLASATLGWLKYKKWF